MKNLKGKEYTPNVQIMKIMLSSLYGKWKTVLNDPKKCTTKKLS